MNWCRRIRGNIRKNEPLKNHTSFKIGGRVSFFIEPRDQSDLRAVLVSLKEQSVPVFVIGAGSNILAGDAALKRAVIRLSAPAFQRIQYSGASLKAGAGARLSQVLSYAIRRGLTGCEFLAGIPGTIGGALQMNAGITERNKDGSLRQRSISDILTTLTVMDYSGKLKVLRKSEIGFGYRTSGLKDYLILSATFTMQKSHVKKVRHSIQRYIGSRLSSQDLSKPSAGCIFKNPSGTSAGRLIDECGLKMQRVNDAVISPKHANFIINYGCARAKDVLQLMSLIKKKVKKKFKIDLEPEITIWK